MPRASYGDRFTVSVVKGESNHVTFDLTSKVVDFCVIDERESKTAEALVVLAEEELVVVDLITPGWPSYSSPYLASLHCSAITAQTTVSVTARLYEKIISHPQMLAASTKTSSRPWPINGGTADASQVDPTSDQFLLLLTGHEVNKCHRASRDHSLRISYYVTGRVSSVLGREYRCASSNRQILDGFLFFW